MRLQSRTRKGISDGRFAAVLAAVALVLILLSLSFSSIAASQLDQIRGLQSQLSSSSGSTSTSQQSTQTLAATTSVAKIAPTTRHVTLVAKPEVITLATNVTYDAWTFNGTVPGPTIIVNQGDLIIAKFINNFTTMAHSIDFHAGQVNWGVDYQPVAPGQSITFNFTADYPGVFMYHCGTSPAIEHIANGMYGMIVVNPSTPLPPSPGGTYYILQSEFYLNNNPGSDGNYAGNYTRMLGGTRPTWSSTPRPTGMSPSPCRCCLTNS